MSIVDMADLRREFVVRRKVGRIRRRAERVAAVDGITAVIEEGESVGYIGANGAGKSTTIKMITGILVPTSGRVRTCGLPPVERRRDLAREIGVVFGQRSQLWWDLPLRESFSILAAIHRLGDASDRIDEIVEGLELASFWDTPVRQLSLGQRMRGEVGAALVHRPRLLLLDEPTIGLDMISKERLRRFLVAERAERQTTILLTTHDMGDIERLCDRVLIVDHGRIAHDGDLPSLRAQVGLERVVTVDFTDPQPALEIPGCRRLPGPDPGLTHAFGFDPDRTTAARVIAAAATHGEIRDLTLTEPPIEDIVRSLYGQ